MCAHRPEITGDYWTPFQDTHLMFIEPIIAKKAHKNVDSTIVHQLRFGNPYNKPLKSFLARNIGGGAGFLGCRKMETNDDYSSEISIEMS